MNSGAVTLDTVMIKIESDAGKANANIGKLASTLRDLKSATSGGFNNINKLAVALERLRDASVGLDVTVANLKHLDGIANTLSRLSDIKAPSGLRQTIKRLNELGETSKSLAQTASQLSTIDNIVQPLQTLTTINKPTGLTVIVKDLKQLSELGNIDNIVNEMAKLPQIIEPLKGLSDIANPKGFKTAVDNLGKLPDVIGRFDTTTFENLKRVSQELAQSLTPLADKMMAVANGYSAFSKIQNTFGKSASTVTRYSKQQHSIFSLLGSTIKRTANNFNNLRNNISSAFGKTALNNLKSFHSKFKQIYLSLLGTRTIFTMIRKAASEYQAFDTSLQKFTTNIWRAFGAQLAPAIEYAMELFKQFVRVIYSVVYAITGIDLIARANAKAMASWSKSAKDTLGNLQKFDDLNVVEFPKGKDDDELISLDKIDLSPIQKIIDAVKNIKNEIVKAINTGKWRNVGRAIAKLINTAVDMINVETIEKKLADVSIKITDMLNGVIDTLSFKSIGSKLKSIFVAAVNTLSILIGNIEWDTLTQGLVDFFIGLDFSGQIEAIDNFVKTISNSINKITGTLNENWNDIKIEAEKAGKAVGNLFNTSLTNIDWSGVTTSIVESLNTLLRAADTAIKTFKWSDLGSSLADIINTAFNTFEFDTLASTISNFCHGLFDSINAFLEKVDWGTIGYKLVTLILEIDWSTLAIDLLDFVQNIYQGLLDAAGGVTASISDFLAELFGGKKEAEKDARTFGERLGEAIAAGNAAGLRYSILHPNDTMGIGGALERIKEFIKVFFGIHSPSTWARDEIGKNLVAGMILPFNNLWSEAKGKFENFKSNLASMFSPNNFTKFGENIMKGISSGLSGLQSLLSSTFKSALNGGLISTLNSAISSINSKLKIQVSSSIASVLKALGANVSSGYYQLFTIPSIPKLATGTNEIPQEGLYHLHPGEAVVPKKYNPALGNGGSEEMVAKMDTLIDIMNNMNFTNIVNVGNKKLYEGQQAFNKTQQNKYGTINLY